MPIKTRKIRKGKMKGGLRWPWSKPARVAPAPPPPPPPPRSPAPNEFYKKYTHRINFLSRGVDLVDPEIDNSYTFYYLSEEITDLVYDLQFAFIYEIWKLRFFKFEFKELFTTNLLESAERRELFLKLRDLIHNFKGKLDNEEAKGDYNRAYNKGNFFDKLERQSLLHIGTYETFDERTYTGNLYINMKRLEEIYEYCHNIEKIKFLNDYEEFSKNKTSFLHYGSKIPPSKRYLFQELMVYSTPDGEASLEARIEEASIKFNQTPLDLRRKITADEMRLREEYEGTLMNVVSNAVERAKSSEFIGAPSRDDIREISRVYDLRARVRMRAAGPGIAWEGGDLSKSVQTTTVPKVVVTGQTLW
jgi:hypothetical protein